jgi:divalent metal cation (Fe/Co/Zn/Cd) transporter
MFGFTATFSFYFGWKRFLNPQPVQEIGLALVVLLIAFFTNGYSFTLSYRRLLKNRSFLSIVKIFYTSSLVETKTTFILDLMGTLASLLGLIALGIYAITGNHRLDGLGAMIIGVNLAILSVFLILGIKDLLVGRSASKETEEKIRIAALSVDEVRRISDMKTMHIGPEKLLVSLDLSMDRSLTTKELERLIDRIERKIREVVPVAKYVLVELES